MTSPIVYVVQEPLKIGDDGVPVPRINYRPLMEFGTLRFLFSWGQLKDSEEVDNRTIMLHLREQLREFSDVDYLAPLGNPGLIAAAVIVASDYNDGKVKVLDWIRDQRCYRVVCLDACVGDPIATETSEHDA